VGAESRGRRKVSRGERVFSFIEAMVGDKVGALSSACGHGRDGGVVKNGGRHDDDGLVGTWFCAGGVTLWHCGTRDIYHLAGGLGHTVAVG
jgi:hypothetical protein